MLILRLVISVAVVGCTAEPSPVEKCDDLVDVVCDRAVQCIPSSAGTHAQCVQVLQGELSCGSVKGVSATYDRCMDQLDSHSCGVLFPTNPATNEPELRLPADCMSVVLTRIEPEEPSRVGELVGAAHE